jgi:hypothetical protein
MLCGAIALKVRRRRRGRAGGPLRGSCHRSGISARRELASQSGRRQLRRAKQLANPPSRTDWQDRVRKAIRMDANAAKLHSDDGADQARELDDCRLCLRSLFNSAHSVRHGSHPRVLQTNSKVWLPRDVSIVSAGCISIVRQDRDIKPRDADCQLCRDVTTTCRVHAWSRGNHVIRVRLNTNLMEGPPNVITSTRSLIGKGHATEQENLI